MTDFNEFERPLSPEKETGSVIAHAWENYKKVILYGILLFIGMSMVSSLITSIFQHIMGIPANDPELMKEIMKTKNYHLLINSPGFTSNISISYIVGLFLYPMYAGFLYLIHKANNNQSLSFGDLFIGYKQNTAQIILYGLITGILTGIGFALCVLPGIILGTMLFLGLPIVFFENKTAIEGIQKSFEICKNNFWTILGIAFLSVLISLSGVLLCCIGIVITMLFVFASMYSAYCAYCGTPYEVEKA